MVDYKFADRAIDIPKSGIGTMMKYASKYDDVVSLGQGTPLFPTPQFIFDYVHSLSKGDSTLGMYASSKIVNELLELVSEEMGELYGFNPGLNSLLATTGGIAGLFAVFMSLLQKGDEVIYFSPSYPLHRSQLYISEATIRYVNYIEEDNWRIDLDAFEDAINDKTKMVILTNPNNPTGTILSREEIERLVEIVLNNNLLLVLDEAYHFLTYETEIYSPLQIEKARDNIILCKSFSKEYAMTGWRIGYVYAHPDIIEKASAVHTHFNIDPSTISIHGAIAALTDPRGKEAMEGFIEQFKKSRETICARLDNLPNLFDYHKPQGAYYTFPKYKPFDMDAMDFCKKLVDEAKVITIPGTSSGPAGDGHIRMSFAANSDVINKAFDRLDEFAKKYGLAG